jgi:hypothetical protein
LTIFREGASAAACLLAQEVAALVGVVDVESQELPQCENGNQILQPAIPGPAMNSSLPSFTLCVTAALLMGAASPARFVDLATPFERAVVASAGKPMPARVAAVRSAVNALLPGIYREGDDADRHLADALATFPGIQAGYDRVVSGFPAALATATSRFRRVFPRFTSPLPIYLYHSLGMRDGGSDDLEPGHRHVMLFGADMIARLHADDSLVPFFDHELFHLEHAHAFPDCDQFWCALWQEGLAVDAAAVMTPGATDHQLMLDVPVPIRQATDPRWTQALCFVSSHFDDTSDSAIAQALQIGARPPSALPERFGYYVGYRIAQETRRPLVELDSLDHVAARRLLRATLVRSMVKAGATCAVPAAEHPTTSQAPHPV